MLFSHYRVHLHFISPNFLVLPDVICEELRKSDTSFSFHNSLEEVIPEVDILYMTRIQKERFVYESVDFENPCLLKLSNLAKAKDDLRILHPLPRMDEIEVDIDNTPYVYYFQQMGNGVSVRMAVLALLLNKVM